jgi:hypothetical protein
MPETGLGMVVGAAAKLQVRSKQYAWEWGSPPQVSAASFGTAHPAFCSDGANAALTPPRGNTGTILVAARTLAEALDNAVGPVQQRLPVLTQPWRSLST